MEKVYNTIVEMIAGRSISFLIDKCSLLKKAPTTEDQSAHSLQRLLRAHVIVEEAKGRNITNQAMVHQLNILRKEMYRGYYTLDNFRSQEGEQTKVHDHGVSHSFALSKFNPAKRLFRSSSGNTHDREELEQVLENLNSIISYMNEFSIFLNNYSPIYRQPYSMHLLLDKFMFARQMEMERIMNFLVRPAPSGTEHVDVLPIVGPPAVGKSTLVSHVCSTERVRDLFSQIMLVTEDDLKDQSPNTSIERYRNNASNGNEAVLVIIELPQDIDEDTWKNIYSTYVSCCSKIIITSRSSKITEFGTTEALVLNYHTREAFWYFFKVVTFGSSDPEEHPKLVSMAMEIVMVMNGSFIWAKFIGGLLRSNLNIEFWSKVFKFVRMCVQMNKSKFEHPNCLMQKNKPTFLPRMACADYFLVRNKYQITIEDVIFGTVECRGRIKVLAWRSPIPPHKNHIFNCEIRKPRRMAK